MISQVPHVTLVKHVLGETYQRARRHQRAAEEAENPEGNVHQQGERNHQTAGAMM